MVRVAQRTIRGKSQNGSRKYVHLAREARALEVFVDFETTSSCHAQVFGRIEALLSRSALAARHIAVRERLGQRIRGAIWQLHRIDRRRPCRQTESPHPRKHEKAHPETTQKDRSGIDFFHVVRIPQNRPGVKGCDCKLLNPLTDINGIRVLSRLGRSIRSSRAPHRYDSDACAFTRALYRGGRNHVGPANVLSCASRLQDPSLRDAVTDDMAAYVGEVMSSVAFRGGLRGR